MNSQEYSTGKNPCFNCKDRYVGCHSNCEKFITWRDLHIQEEKKKKDILCKEHTLNIVRNQGIRNIKKINPKNKVIRSRKKI